MESVKNVNQVGEHIDPTAEFQVRIPFFRSPYNYDRVAASNAATIEAQDGYENLPSLTVQSHAEDVDINVLMQRFGVTGHLPENPRPPTFGDFTGIGDFQSALHAVMDAEARFMEFPAEIRARFENDPQKMLLFVSDPANVEECYKIGLAKRKVDSGGSQGSGGSPGAASGVAGGASASAAGGDGSKSAGG